MAESVNTKISKGISPKRAFLLGVGALAVGGAIYFTGKTILKKKEESESEDSGTESNETTKIASPSPVKFLSKANDNFPLKKGSRGNRVTQLQEAVQKIIGETKMKTFSDLDGNFRKGTEDALREAKLPTVIDEATFNKLTGTSSNVPVMAASPLIIGIKLYSFAVAKNYDGVMAMLRQLRNVADYSQANKSFIAQQVFSVSNSIVTYLLNVAFRFNANAKTEIKKEFLRIGLKSSAKNPLLEDGKWSLSGLSGSSDIITITNTYVIDKRGKKIPVKSTVILGEATQIKNGMTSFNAIDGQVYSVPTQHIKYTA